MAEIENMLDRRQGETEAEFLARVVQENADLKVGIDVLAAASGGGVTADARLDLLARARQMLDSAERARAIEMIQALPPE